MKYFGEIPTDHLKLTKELQELERWFDEYGQELPVLPVAKGMVCLGYDYYSIYFDEEGERLLKRAEKIFPGYFKGPIYVDIEKDKDFALLVRLLKDTLGHEVMVSLGFDEQI